MGVYWTVKRAFIVIAALAGVSCLAFAQDSPTYKGENGRSGKTVDPISNDPTIQSTNGPGQGDLFWFHPTIAENRGHSYLVDNTNIAATSFTAGWTVPTTGLAGGYYFPSGYAAGTPPYLYAPTIASALGSDPTLKLNPSDSLETASFTVQPTDILPRGYALSINVPVGPTNGVYQQRYMVVKIQYGAGASEIDVVDTNVSGGGWVRLGNGGKATDRLYDYDGTHPFIITIYNTIPRDAGGALLGTPGLYVYADAVRAIPDGGSITATPIIRGWTTSSVTYKRAITVYNKNTSVIKDGKPATVVTALANCYNLGDGSLAWSYSPQTKDTGGIIDDLSSGVTFSAGFTSATTASNYYGTDYLAAPIVNNLGTADNVTYAPVLQDGQYDLYVWLPGDSNGETFGHSVRYEIHEGATVTTVTIDQSVASGWFRLGTRKFTSANSIGNPLSVVITNYSADSGDLTRKSYADAVWFVGTANHTVKSTPVLATVDLKLSPSSSPVPTDVAVFAGEDGKIYCVDAIGDGLGGTKVYWTYPSTPDPANPSWTDPNHVAGLDGPGGIAVMPNGFDISSAMIQHLSVSGGQDRLYIAASNGRVYCIDMTGRGDMDLVNNKPGTTTRYWTYPDDYPATPMSSALGAFRGSVAFATTTGGQALVIVPAPQGRVYALDAVGNSSNLTTTPLWMYPSATSPTLGAIVSTPAVDFGSVFVGTLKDNFGNPGKFLSLKVDDGTVNWTFTGEPSLPADDFLGGPTTASDANMSTSGQGDTVFVSNENLTIYALKASDGTILWKTSELQASVHGPLTFAWFNAFDNSGVRNPFPLIMVPTTDGRIEGLFARTADVNRRGAREAWEYTAAGGFENSFAVGQTFMVTGDQVGYTMAFHGNGGLAGGYDPTEAPGNPGVPPNDPSNVTFNQAKVKLITKTEFEKLLTGLSSDYAEATGSAAADPSTAFEWGQTLYLMFYDFPADPQTVGVNALVTATLSVAGMTSPVTTPSFKFSVNAPSDSGNSYNPSGVLDGFALVQYPLDGSGQFALAPGSATVFFSLNYKGANYSTDPTSSIFNFKIGNPLGLVMKVDGSGDPIDNQSIGYTTDLTKAETTTNDSTNVYSDPSNDKSRLTTTPGNIVHGQNGIASVYFVDRSVLSLLHGAGGLTNVRVLRQDLAWMNGPTVVKPLPAPFVGFEDLPTNFPNTSLDYPDIKRERIAVTQQTGGSGDPVFSGVSLIPPTIPDPANIATRTMELTQFDFEAMVPKFQPPNAFNSWTDSSGANVPTSNYVGKMVVYIDTLGNGVFDPLSKRSPYRTFNYALGVPIDERFSVASPIVDLGTLGSGVGYTPISPGTAGTTYDPTAFAPIFKPFIVMNDGNVNLINMRLAKGYQVASNIYPWPVYSQTNEANSWLDGSVSLHSTLDSQTIPTNFALTNPVVAMKSRVSYLGSTRLDVNPKSRIDGHQAVSGASGDAKISVSVPVGFPAGSYTQRVGIIEDTGTSDEILQTGENQADPFLTLKFVVGESRMTTTVQPYAAPMVDNSSIFTSGNFNYENLQPAAARDAASGHLVMAFVSDRDQFVPSTTANPDPLPQLRLYLTSIAGALPNWHSLPSGGVLSPLNDLLGWTPASSSQWMNQSVGPFPDTNPSDPSYISPDVLFDSATTGGSIVAGTARFHSASFPETGTVDPFNPTGAPFSSLTMAFVGDAQKQTPVGRITENRLFASILTIGAGGAITLTDLTCNGSTAKMTDMQSETLLPKRKTSVVQTASNGAAVIFYGTDKGIQYVTFDGTSFGTQSAIPMPAAMESVSSPSAVGRLYRGTSKVIDVAFSGKLNGRQAQEIYMCRLNADASGNPTGLAYQPLRTRDLLEYDTAHNQYETQGLVWNPNPSTPVTLETVVNGVYTNIEVAGTRTTDRSSGVISFTTTLGGTAIIDPNSGVVRLSSLRLPQGIQLALTYQPTFLRVSSGQSGFSDPSMAFDWRLVGAPQGATQFSYWAKPDNTAALTTDPNQPTADRYWFTYSRGAGGSSDAARPFMSTMRLGIALPTPVYTNAGGSIASFAVSGATSFYQIDPSAGKVYFEAADEDQTVTITYTGADPITGNALTTPIVVTAPVRLISERSQAPVIMDHPVNEAGLTLFVDPLQQVRDIDTSTTVTAPYNMRRGLVWMFWHTTRFGRGDIFFQTLSPQFDSVVSGG
ncbi:MAG: PQQ-binding-like beta-propeller repeat protein [Armatimonadetes bacterium]|nr:PQQ-binding-like beta-propeller repeat protein [Armatimonadota bacterium]